MRYKEPCVYILASAPRGTLYVGVTSNLIKRVWEHKSNAIIGFSSNYRTHVLVWFEPHESMEAAIVREKQIKEWRRIWKIELIERSNTDWQDLYSGLL